MVTFSTPVFIPWGGDRIYDQMRWQVVICIMIVCYMAGCYMIVCYMAGCYTPVHTQVLRGLLLIMGRGGYKMGKLQVQNCSLPP